MRDDYFALIYADFLVYYSYNANRYLHKHRLVFVHSIFRWLRSTAAQNASAVVVATAVMEAADVAGGGVFAACYGRRWRWSGFLSAAYCELRCQE
nr:hypothetical protein Iba_chr07bCG7010 [Ipomoea batatas]